MNTTAKKKKKRKTNNQKKKKDTTIPFSRMLEGTRSFLSQALKGKISPTLAL